MDLQKAKSYLDRVLFHKLSMLATRQRRMGVSKAAAAKIVEAEAVRFLVANAGVIGIKPGTPAYDEVVEFAVDLAANAVDAEYSH